MAKSKPTTDPPEVIERFETVGSFYTDADRFDRNSRRRHKKDTLPLGGSRGTSGEGEHVKPTNQNKLKPIEVIERGEIDRLWNMVFRLQTGMPG